MNISVNFITALLAIITGILTIACTMLSFRVGKIGIKKAEIEKDKAEIEKESIRRHDDAIIQSIAKLEDVSEGIGRIIAEQLLNNPSWLDKYMDMTGTIYSGSVYGRRIKHFYNEKKVLAKMVVDHINTVIKSSDLKLCLLIDSGSTTYHLFMEICNILGQDDHVNWINNVYIISNNIPGVQYLMKYGKKEVDNPHSDIIINCFLLPGKPLAAYAATTGNETNEFINNIENFLCKEWKCERDKFEIIGFITGNYFTTEFDNEKKIISFHPVARGEGHVAIKELMAKKSDKVYLLSPLMKFSYATVDILNSVNEFTISRSSKEASELPQKVKYEKILIDKDKCSFFTTARYEKDFFHQFFHDFQYDLQRIYNGNVFFAKDFRVTDCIKLQDGSFTKSDEISYEIPHDNLRKKFEAKSNIWCREWVISEINKKMAQN